MIYKRAFHYKLSSCFKRNMQNYITVNHKDIVTCKHCIKELGIPVTHKTKARLTLHGGLR